MVLMNKKGVEYMAEKMGLEKFFIYLEKAQGGHGNGVAIKELYDNGNYNITIKKGLNYTCANAVRDIEKAKNLEWVIFHTRIASLGAKTNKNCHPYKMDKTILCMNGTEREFGFLASMLDTTDSECVLKCIKAFDLPLLKTLSKLSSNFMGFDNGIPYITSPNSSYKSYDIINEDGIVIISSQLPSFADKKIQRPIGFPLMWDGTIELLTKVHEEPKFMGGRETGMFQIFNPNSETINKTKEETAKKWKEQIFAEATKDDSSKEEESQIMTEAEKKRYMEILNARKDRDAKETNKSFLDIESRLPKNIEIL